MQAANITDQKVIKDIMPLHPMAALVLKNIASAFASNQRSMFDFIKVKDDSQAFQWFISNFGPDDDYPLLTIDMLWDFFYEKGKDNLSPDIRMIRLSILKMSQKIFKIGPDGFGAYLL